MYIYIYYASMSRYSEYRRLAPLPIVRMLRDQQMTHLHHPMSNLRMLSNVS
jgi:hypothetical protein